MKESNAWVVVIHSPLKQAHANRSKSLTVEITTMMLPPSNPSSMIQSNRSLGNITGIDIVINVYRKNPI
jgi:hypothetical protein